MKNVIRKYFMKLVMLAVLAFVFNSTNVFAQVPIVFQQGLGGYAGTHDTTFQTGDPLDIWGDLPEWEWDGSDENGFNFGMLRFDDIIGDGAGQIPPGSTILSAILTLNVTNQGDSTQIATMHDLLMPFDDTLDFFEFGDGAGFDPRPGIDYVEDVIAEIPGPSVGDVLELDVTESLQKIVAGGDNFGWVFIPGGSNGVGIASSEAASNQPKLTVVIEGTSPPTAVRTIANTFFLAGGSVNVTIVVTPGGGGGDVTIEETLPAGWTASNISNGGSASGGVVTWTLAALAAETTLSYTANAPAAPDNKVSFSGSINGQFFVEGDADALFQEPLGIFDNHLDIGAPGADGSATYDASSGTYTVVGSGHDIWDSADDFHFLYREVSGDVTLVATIDLQQGGGEPTWAKAGPMVRNDLTPGSAHGFAMIRNGGQDYGPQWRDSQGAGGAWDGDATLVGGKTNTGEQEGKVEIERIGTEINFYYYDPTTDERIFWYVHDVTDMEDPVYAGLAVTSHTTGEISTGIFTDVVLTVNGQVLGEPADVIDWSLY